MVWTPEQKQAGLNSIAVGEGPSWGTEYKVKPNGKVEVSGGVGLALKGGAEINNDYFSILQDTLKNLVLRLELQSVLTLIHIFQGFLET